MADCARQQDRVLMFDLNNRARLDSQFVKAKIREGGFGHINSAQAVWMRRTGIPGFGGWFTSKAMAGGGPLIDLLHMVDLALWFMDYPEPAAVLARTFDDFISDPNFHGAWGEVVSPAAKNDVESACHGFVTFKTGQCLTLHSSWAELIKEEDTFVSLQGSQKGVKIRTINDLNRCEFFAQKDGASVDESYRFKHDTDMGRTSAPANFIASLNGEEEPLTTAAEAVALMRIIDAVYLSASSGKPVQMADLPQSAARDSRG
jgi:predicted dehydrogenase